MSRIDRFRYNVSKYTAEEKFTTATWLFLKRAAKKIPATINKLAAQSVRNKLARRTKIIDNKIVFITFQGDYTCNPKYITEEFIKRGLHTKYDLVWAGRKASIKKMGSFPAEVRTVDIYSFEMMQELASAKVIISNSVEYQKRRLPIKPGQIVIQTWHGSFGIKRFDKDHNAGKAWVKAAEVNAKDCAYCISNSEFENDVYRESFWDKSEILEYGHPRSDILISVSDEEREKHIRELRAKYDIPEGVRTVMYGPTFRDSHNFDCYNIEPEHVLNALKERFGGDWVFLTRYHPTVRKKRATMGEHPYIKDVSTHQDIQELMLLADIAITDYSSWIYDFVLTRKPGFIFATDIAFYNNERGFYYPLEATPFPIATSAAELVDKIAEFDMDKYAVAVEEFLNDKGSFEDGHASERVVDKIVEVTNVE